MIALGAPLRVLRITHFFHILLYVELLQRFQTLVIGNYIETALAFMNEIKRVLVEF